MIALGQPSGVNRFVFKVDSIKVDCFQWLPKDPHLRIAETQTFNYELNYLYYISEYIFLQFWFFSQDNSQMIWWRNEISPEFQFWSSLLLVYFVWSVSSSGADFLSLLCHTQWGPWSGKADLWEPIPIQISVSSNIMISQGAECAVRSWFTNKDPCERALGSTQGSGTMACLITASLLRDRNCLLCVTIFSHMVWFLKRQKMMGWSALLLCFPIFLLNSDACRYISFSFKFFYLSSSFNTTKNSIPKNLYACFSLKLHPALLPLQMKTVILKVGILTDTIKQTPQWQPGNWI